MAPRPPLPTDPTPEALRARLRELVDEVREDLLPTLVAAAESAADSSSFEDDDDIAPAAIVTDEEFLADLRASGEEVARGETISWEVLLARLTEG